MKLIYPQPGRVIAVDAELQSLRPTPLAPVPKATLQNAGAYTMPFGNARLDSRVAALGFGALREIWRAEVSPDTQPRFVLQSGGNIVVQGPIWQLFDMAGNSLGMGSKGPAPVYLDTSRGLLLSINPTGLLAAYSLRDGKRQFFVMPDAGERAIYTLIDGGGGELLMAAFRLPEGNFEQLGPPGPAAPEAPRISSMELLVWPTAEAVSHGGLRPDAVSTRVDVFSERIVAARNGESIVFAVRNALFLTDKRFVLKQAFALEGLPLALSLDEVGRVYLILETPGNRQLMQIGPAGELGYSIVLAAGSEKIPAPPVVGYDHRVYVMQGEDAILALDPAGRQVWIDRPGARVAGIVATPDGRLIVSVGSTLLAYDAAGKRSTLYEVPGGAALVTPPAIAADGTVLVATEKTLFALRMY